MTELLLKQYGLTGSYEPEPLPPPAPVPATIAPVDTTSDFRKFLTSPVPQGTIVQCQVLRDRSGWENMLYPQYFLHLTKDNSFLLCARKRKKNKNSNYLISLDKEDMHRKTFNYFGKLTSNVMGSEFVVHDRGCAPEDFDPTSNDVSRLHLREELGAIFYDTSMPSLVKCADPRRLRAVLPRVSEETGQKLYVFKGHHESDGLLSCIRNNEFSRVHYIESKQPQFVKALNAYTLDFNGRVTKPSIKNFQLVDPDRPKDVVLQFGKVKKDEFTLDMQWPMVPLVAFGLALSSFDTKVLPDLR